MNVNNLLWLNKHTCVKALLLIFYYCLLLHRAFGQAYPYKFNYLTVDEGLSHTDANDILQDKRGYIWIATHFGLDRFDGYTVKKFYNGNEPLNNSFKNRVKCLYAEDNGNIWLGTEGGVQCFDPKTEKYLDFSEVNKQYVPNFDKMFKPAGNRIYGFIGDQLKLYQIKDNILTEQKLNLPSGVVFSDITSDKNGLFYLTSNKGLWTLDKNNHFKNLPITALPDQQLHRIYFDNRNHILLGSGNKLFLIGIEAKNSAQVKSLTFIKQYITVNKDQIWNIAEAGASDYWLNTGADLIRLDVNLNLVQVVNNKGPQRGLNSNSLSKIFIDRSECLWICTFGGGLNYCDLHEKLFYTLQHNAEAKNSLAGNHIRSVLADGDKLWIGTTASGLNLYNLKTQKFSYYNSYNSPVRLKNDAITALTLDNDHNLWIGSARGIQVLKPDGITLWQPATSDKFPDYVIDTFTKDYYGNIWFGNHRDRCGVVWKDEKNYYHVKYYGVGFFIFADTNKPQLFISSTQGLKRLLVDKQGNITQSFEYRASAKPNSLSSDYTYPIVKQDDSNYWIGTIGGGLDKLTINTGTNTFSIKTYAGDYGIFNDVESMEIDNAGNLWMGGNGLECFNPTTGKLIRYDKNDGLQGNSFKVGSSYKGTDGRLYFGGINGLNYFYPDQIKPNSIAAQPVLTDILINNKKPDYGKPGISQDFIPQAIGYCNKLTLNYLQNNFQVFFSSMHFANPLKCRYRYKLTGYDKDWKYTDGKTPSAAYSNLDYSSYRLIVEATNSDGIWSKSRVETDITIIPPWWKSALAKVVYVLLALSALAGIYIYQARWYRLKREIEVNAINEKKREEMHKQREELYQQQLMFFTNVSHEFRTPLTLILGPLENLISQNKNPALDYSYQLMFRNAKRLINLISELMNFKKVSDSIIKLQVQPLVANLFCKDMAWEFQNLAVSKGISFEMTDHTENPVSPVTGYFDVQILEKILFNLLNNSFKYTNSGGKVSFDIFFDMDKFKPAFNTGVELLNKDHQAKKHIYFRVADTGIGISGESITSIFDRYYRISKNHLGSGVGLAMVKSLTQLHKGDIYVYSERYQGTEIIIGIPWGEENYNEAEKAASRREVENQLEAIDNAMPPLLSDQEGNSERPVAKSRKHILLVEDNHELRTFLKKAFENYYVIYEAGDGNSAIEIATEKVPDMIISDIMMPGMNGIELCKLVKEKFETSHIPFIILSAKDALDTKIEGMESGADFYFAKPLSVDLLLLTVNNIFDQSEKLKQRYVKDYLSEATELVHLEKDKEFFQKLIALIENNIQDPNLDVDFLCKHLYLSRTKLYQKIKSISDQSVGDFIRTIRLKKAVQIMTHEDITMNEVADRIGLQSNSNFSRAFKKEYGKSPMQFMQSLKKS
jgi:signal transduction histidine kinase/DNA-binding response OmpR family regulator/ligand-binding sensor domain-containing protein